MRRWTEQGALEVGVLQAALDGGQAGAGVAHDGQLAALRQEKTGVTTRGWDIMGSHMGNINKSRRLPIAHWHDGKTWQQLLNHSLAWLLTHLASRHEGLLQLGALHLGRRLEAARVEQHAAALVADALRSGGDKVSPIGLDWQSKHKTACRKFSTAMRLATRGTALSSLCSVRSVVLCPIVDTSREFSSTTRS